MDGSDGECVLTAVDCGNGIRASLCAECGGAGTDKASCGGQCAWMSRSGVCRDAFSNKVRTSSVHLNYEMPRVAPKPLWWFQRVVVRDSADVSYFASSVHAFGYGGVQQVTTAPQPFAGRAIFSIWDQGGPSQFRGTPDCNESAALPQLRPILTVAESFAKF